MTIVFKRIACERQNPCLFFFVKQEFTVSYMRAYNIDLKYV